MTITSIQLIILHPNLLPVTSHNGVICHVAHFLTSSWSLICISHPSYPLKYLLCLSSQSPQPTCTCEAGNLSSTFLALQHWEQEQLLAMTPTFRSTSSSLIGGNIVLLGAKWNWLEMGHQPPTCQMWHNQTNALVHNLSGLTYMLRIMKGVRS